MKDDTNVVDAVLKGLILGLGAALLLGLIIGLTSCGDINRQDASPPARLAKATKEKAGAMTRKGKAVGMGIKEKQNALIGTYHDCLEGGCDVRELFRGPNGNKGNTGSDGDNGEDGNDGAAGPTGATGATGATGEPGADGADGLDGEDGIDGEDGARGPRGYRGSTGRSGRNGVDGRDGVDGADGTSCYLEDRTTSCNYWGSGYYKRRYDVYVVCGEDDHKIDSDYEWLTEPCDDDEDSD